MAITRVQAKSLGVAGGQTATTTVNGVTTGNTLVVWVEFMYGDVFGGTPPTVSDGTNTYTLKLSITSGGSTACTLYGFVADNVTGGNLTVNVSATSGGAYYHQSTVIEYAGLANPSFDQQAVSPSGASNPGNPWSVGPLTPATADALLCGANGRVDSTNDYAPDSPWAQVDYTSGNSGGPAANGLFTADRIVSSAAAYSYTGSAAATGTNSNVGTAPERVGFMVLKGSGGGGVTAQVWPYLDDDLCGGFCGMGMGGL